MILAGGEKDFCLLEAPVTIQKYDTDVVNVFVKGCLLYSNEPPCPFNRLLGPTAADLGALMMRNTSVGLPSEVIFNMTKARQQKEDRITAAIAAQRTWTEHDGAAANAAALPIYLEALKMKTSAGSSDVNIPEFTLLKVTLFPLSLNFSSLHI